MVRTGYCLWTCSRVQYAEKHICVVLLWCWWRAGAGTRRKYEQISVRPRRNLGLTERLQDVAIAFAPLCSAIYGTADAIFPSIPAPLIDDDQSLSDLTSSKTHNGRADTE